MVAFGLLVCMGAAGASLVLGVFALEGDDVVLASWSGGVAVLLFVVSWLLSRVIARGVQE